MGDLPEIMSVREVAKALKLTDETVCGYIRRSELRASALGTDRSGGPCPPYAIRRMDLVDFLDRRVVTDDSPVLVPVKRGANATRERRAPRRRHRNRPLVVARAA